MQFKAIWEKNSPASKFLIAVGMLIVGAFVFSLVAFGLASVIYGIDPIQLQELMNDFDNPLTIAVLKMIQTVSEIGTFILPALFLAYTFSKSSTQYLRLNKR